MTKEYITPNNDHRLLETEAGQRFLYALRRSAEKNDVIVPQARTSPNRISKFEVNDIDSLRKKRVSLRATLEELIIEYLQSLSPDSEPEDFHKLRRRRKRRLNEVYENAIKNGTTSVQDDNNATHENTTFQKNIVCNERKRKISQLDRIELEKALQNDSETEQNIRRLLNYR